MIKSQTEAKLVKALRGNEALKALPLFQDEKMNDGVWSYRAIEKYLNEKIPAGMPGITTFASVWNWEREIHPVTDACLMAWMQFYPEDDPRHQLAVDIFALRMAKSAGHVHSPSVAA